MPESPLLPGDGLISAGCCSLPLTRVSRADAGFETDFQAGFSTLGNLRSGRQVFSEFSALSRLPPSKTCLSQKIGDNLFLIKMSACPDQVARRKQGVILRWRGRI
jgi:hypothetical protein